VIGQSISKQFIDGVIGRKFASGIISYQSWFPAGSGEKSNAHFFIKHFALVTCIQTRVSVLF